MSATAYRAALVAIEAWMPIGSVESLVATDGLWRGFVRDLQRVARLALKDASP